MELTGFSNYIKEYVKALESDYEGIERQIREGYVKLSIKEIHNMVGFESADYFRKCFKSQFNMTPSDYAVNYKETEQE